MEGNASVHQVYPVGRTTSEERAACSKGWGPGFEQEVYIPPGVIGMKHEAIVGWLRYQVRVALISQKRDAIYYGRSASSSSVNSDHAAEACCYRGRGLYYDPTYFSLS